MKMNKKLVRSYLKDVASALTCKKSLKAVFISDLREDVSDFLAEAPNSTMQDVYKNFGTPKAIADGFAERKDYEELLKRAKRKATVWKWSCIIAAIIALLTIAGFTYLSYTLNGSIDVTEVSKSVFVFSKGVSI